MTHTARCISPSASMATLLAPSIQQARVTASADDNVDLGLTAPTTFAVVAQALGSPGHAGSHVTLLITYKERQLTIAIALPRTGDAIRILLPYGAARIQVARMFGEIDYLPDVVAWIEEPQEYEVSCRE